MVHTYIDTCIDTCRCVCMCICISTSLFFFFRGMGASACHPLSWSSTPTRDVRSVVSPRFWEVCVSRDDLPSQICTPSGNALTCLSTRSRPVERPSAQYSLTNWSVNFLPRARWLYFTKIHGSQKCAQINGLHKALAEG